MGIKPTEVVIVGAGASARLVAKSLKANKANVNVTLVQPNKFATLPWYQTLVLTKRETLEQNSTFQPVPDVDTTVFGVAVATSDGMLAVQPLDKKTDSVDMSAAPMEIPFEILVAATGSKFPTLLETPGQSQQERKAEVDRVSKALLSGKDVVIAGGGSVGVELAADLLEALPADTRQGKVTLICTTGQLLADLPSYYGERAQEVLEGLGAKIVYNDRVVSHADTALTEDGKPVELTLKSGTKLPCEAYIAAYQRGANTSWLTTPYMESDKYKPLPNGIVNDKGQVRVNSFLQSEKYDKLYAVAAVNNRSEPALAMNVEAEAKAVADNISGKQTKVAPGVEHTVYQMIGRETFAMFIPESLPIPGCCSTLCCTWCGFPCNLLCPCFLCGVVCGPLDPMTCGYCCGRPEGKGTTNTFQGFKDTGMLAQNMNYVDVGQAAPPAEQAMER